MDDNTARFDRGFLLISENPKIQLIDLIDGTNLTTNSSCESMFNLEKDDINFSDHKEAGNWKQSLEFLLSDFRDMRKSSLPLGAILHQKRTPGYLENGLHPELRFTKKQISFSASVLANPISLKLDSEFDPIFPFLDSEGKPIQYTNHVPIPIKLGYSRSYTLVEQPLSWGDHRRQNAVQLQELFSEAGKTIRNLPSKTLKSIWKRRGPILKLSKDPKFCWIDALFEFSWTSTKNKIALERRVHDASGDTSLVLNGEGLFPRIPYMPKEMSALLENFPHEAGIPFSYSSKIDNCLEASIELINWILTDEWNMNESTDNPLKVFISYCHEDEPFLKLLKKCLKPLTRKNKLELWYDREILAGSNLDSSISKKLDDTDVFISLLSSDFLDSDYCTGIELKRAVERAQEGNLCLIGIVIRPCAWQHEFPRELLVLPKDATAVTKWYDQDDAWLNITNEINRLSIELIKTAKPWSLMMPSDD
ncbi:hypothetical protein V6x_27370 [Gimesia chilikensis]|uniref:TIR domain-containing protein n=1 Tax=Gimesia chilikensis TaxID=2605989 RepID=A0A517WCQ1_9PLAN|nr:toll/interleukin-1 receptor domain-containing protein [Gimesia chilikensis]QDU03027.1 hypothetical protein V6x_27370 [Gimesia chilikensis]